MIVSFIYVGVGWWAIFDTITVIPVQVSLSIPNPRSQLYLS
jgi:hypothetical protein